MPTNTYAITKVKARAILDSRGNPTVQVDVNTRGGFGRFSVPSGASKGRFEAVELRDNSKAKFHGMGVSKAIRNVEKILGPAILGIDSRSQEEVDKKLNELDGTENKSHLGANALLGVSMAECPGSLATVSKFVGNFKRIKKLKLDVTDKSPEW